MRASDNTGPPRSHHWGRCWGGGVGRGVGRQRKANCRKLRAVASAHLSPQSTRLSQPSSSSFNSALVPPITPSLLSGNYVF